MKNTQCCVIDTDNYYVDLFVTYEDDEGELRVYGYTMQPGDRILNVLQPLKRLHAGCEGFVKPRWDEETAAWVEGATDEEMAEWEAEHPAPEIPDPPEPSGNLEERVAALEKAQAEIWSAQAAAIREGVNSVD